MTPDTLKQCLVFPMLIVITILGGAGSSVWPICGVWAVIGFARSGRFSPGAGIGLCVLGLVQDVVHEAPFGAWPFAFFSAWLVAIGYTATLAHLFADRVGTIGRAMVVVTVSIAALDVAVTVAGSGEINAISLIIDLLITVLIWPAVAPLLMQRRRA